MKQKIFLIVMLLLAVSAKAQFSLGPAASVMYAPLKVGTVFFAPGFIAEYGINDNFIIRTGAHYALPSTVNSTVLALADDPFADPQTIKVTKQNTYSFWGAHIDYKSYIGDGSIIDGGMFFTAGIGTAGTIMKVQYGNYDSTQYSLIGFEYGLPYTTTAFQVLGRGSFGYETSYENACKLGIEAFVNAPITTSAPGGIGLFAFDNASLPILFGVHAFFTIPIGWD